MSVYGLLFGPSLCIGCKACEQACQAEHGQALHEAARLDQDSCSRVQQVGPETFMKNFCKHCEDGALVLVYPGAALPKYGWRSVDPRVPKCDLWLHRVTDKRPTACASICPTGATTFGRRDDLLREGGERCVNGLYGEGEVGGTGALMLLPLFFAQFLVVLGMIFNCLNAGVTALQLGTGAPCVPSWPELTVSLGLISTGFALLALAVRHLRVFPEGLVTGPRPVIPFLELEP
jgi:Fe-S-cluster-containing dehydrogenase component